MKSWNAFGSRISMNRRLPLTLLLLACGGGGSDQISGPSAPSPSPAKFTVTVGHSLGVSANPDMGTTNVANGETFTYSFAALPGYENLHVYLDTSEVGPTGSFVVKKDRVLSATSSAVAATPATSTAMVNALKGALSGLNPMPSVRQLLTQFTSLSDADPIDAVSQLQTSLAKAYDPVSDALPIADMLLRINDSLQAQETAGTTAATSRGMPKSAVNSAGPVTTIYYVNGILTDPTSASVPPILIRSLLLKTPYTDPNAYPILLSYNESWKFSLKRDALADLACMQGVATRVRSGDMSAIGGLRKCFAFSIGDLILGDIPESVLQFINVSYGAFPPLAQPDAQRLADKIAAGLANNGRVLIIAHSQGNLVTAEALGILKSGPSRDALKCLGIIGLAPPTPTPIGGTSAVISEIFAKGQQSKDILLQIAALESANAQTQKIENGETLAWETAIASEWLWKAYLRIAAGLDIHGVEASYLGQPETRSWTRSALTQTLATLEKACPQAAPAIQLSATVANFSATVGGQNPPSQGSLEITNAGAGTLDGLSVGAITYGVGPSGWLVASLNSAAAPAKLSLAVTTGPLGPGTYSALVPIRSSSPSVTNSPQAVTVTLVVSAAPAPAIGLSASTITFSGTVGGANPGAQTVQVSNKGTGTLDGIQAGVTYQTGQQTGWLSASLSSQVAPSSLSLTSNGAGLPAGTYNANVSITSTAAGISNSPQSVAVSLTIAPAVKSFQLDDISIGGNHSCVATSTQEVYCWGRNDFGQIGDGSLIDRPTATLVVGSHSFTALAAGASHTCGISVSGSAYCWGGNTDGTLGDGSTTSRSGPVQVSGGLTFTSITAGDYHTCGLTNTGAAYCWGFNFAGELGDGSTISRSTPVKVMGNQVFQSISAGSGFTCGITAAGVAYCWGYNLRGQLGDGTTTSRSTPTPVAGNYAFTRVSAGYDHTCAVTSMGTAYCWGSNQFYLSTQPAQPVGKLGDGTTTDRLIPTPVSGSLTFSNVSAGTSHTCAATSNEVGYCWGDNTFNELGSAGAAALTPRNVATSIVFRVVRAGQFYSCGISTGNNAYCWGANGYGQLGDGTTTNRTEPTHVLPP